MQKLHYQILQIEQGWAMNQAYWIFVAMVVFTVSSPGPGVLMTLDNAIAAGWRAAMHGVLGLAIGAAAMAALSAAGIGLLIRSSPLLFVLLKYCGVAYLFYLSYKTWSRTSQALGGARGNCDAGVTLQKRMVAGAILQTSNPKSLFFFLSVLPQLAEGKAGQPLPLVAAVATYCIVLILVHGLYAGLAARARTWLSQPGAARLLSRLSALMFFAFGVTMLTLKL
ncbi:MULTISPECIES: LysE family translocator [unclassified Janthinobacterium]|uniref:LysE family translocator n=1 Tax=unclassified Janthinobacterium TaxID=2610881 RepID=UPI00034BC702|nr:MULTISPECIES: LysE family translocator [unclassified Janthinobacterium]MEC5163940.1 homoserine/homoserine lactone efflux protein [Janthinobacterium sp. CG_S6]